MSKYTLGNKDGMLFDQIEKLTESKFFPLPNPFLHLTKLQGTSVGKYLTAWNITSLDNLGYHFGGQILDCFEYYFLKDPPRKRTALGIILVGNMEYYFFKRTLQEKDSLGYHFGGQILSITS